MIDTLLLQRKLHAKRELKKILKAELGNVLFTQAKIEEHVDRIVDSLCSDIASLLSQEKTIKTLKAAPQQMAASLRSLLGRINSEDDEE